jgi:hypothetical protein
MLRRGSKSASPKPPKPAKAPKAPKAAKPKTGVFVQKAKSDVYTVMLGLSLAAILIAILFMFLEMSRYDMDFKAQSVQHVRPTAGARLV